LEVFCLARSKTGLDSDFEREITSGMVQIGICLPDTFASDFGSTVLSFGCGIAGSNILDNCVGWLLWLPASRILRAVSIQHSQRARMHQEFTPW